MILFSGLLVLAAATYGIYSLLHHPPVVPFQSMSIRKLTDSGKVFTAAIAPDGKYVVHVVSDAGQQSLWIRHIATNSNTQIVPAMEARYTGLTFSPDGNYIYFIRGEKDRPWLGLLYQIPVLGGTPKLIVTEVDSRISFSPDGQHFTFRRSYDLGGSSVMVSNTDAVTKKN
jgi:eukaryotic-like serine/threonine-protein kinase